MKRISEETTNKCENSGAKLVKSNKSSNARERDGDEEGYADKRGREEKLGLGRSVNQRQRQRRNQENERLALIPHFAS